MSEEYSRALVEIMGKPTMLRPRITRINQSFTLEFQISEGVIGAALTDDLLAVLKKHAPKEPEPGDVTRDAFVAASESGAKASECWDIAEAAAREGYVSKAEIRKALERTDLVGAETCDLIDAIVEIRELVK